MLPSFIEFDPVTLDFTIHRSLFGESKDYKIKLQGQLEPSEPGVIDYTEFVLTVNGCDQTVISEFDIFDISYTYKDTATPFSGTPFTESFGVCGPFTYTASLSDDSPLPGLISFNPLTLEFSVDPNLITDSIVYTVKLLGTLPTPGPSKSIEFTVTLVGCD